MSNYYADVISLIESPNFSMDKVFFEIAKNNPKAIISANNRLLEKRSKDTWRDKCQSLVDGGDIILAIKTCREITGMSILDAKNSIDLMKEKK